MLNLFILCKFEILNKRIKLTYQLDWKGVDHRQHDVSFEGKKGMA